MRRDSWRSVPMMCRPAGVDHLLVAPLPFLAHRGLLGLVVACGGEIGIDAAAEHDVGAAARHVGGDGDRAGPPRLGDDLGLARVLLGVQHLVLELLLGEHAGEQLRGLDRGGADQHRLAALLAVADVLEDRVELVLAREVHEVRMILADHRHVGRDHHDLEAVDLQELEGFGIGRAGHAGQRLVHAEVVLEGDRGERLVLLADLDAFLGLDGLVQAVGPAPARAWCGR
jgi:hypothetical protein